MKKNGFGILIMLLILITGINFSSAQNADEIGELYKKLEWRCIGPAAMGGRTVDIEAVENKPWIIYAAVGPSGVWKSNNNGTTWFPVFHKENTVSVGDIAISQSHPGIIWVGTGEATCRNSVTIGDGVYKSENAGKTWTHLGLDETRHISRIIINPGDPNIVYVAAMGHLWGPNEERGIYKTLDGGKTWEKILFINKDTGIADLAMDPSDSLTLYAAAYDHRRLPYCFSSGGPGSALYKTEDGGKTWEKLTRDLPEGILGRIGIGVSRSAPNVVYALIEHEDGGIWRSEDRGKSWVRTCDNETYKNVNFRPFYYSQIRVDPTDDTVVYVFSGGLFVSKDMGKKFKPIGRGTHPDHHALWIDPSNPLHLIDGNDGGIDISYDGGKNWNPVQHMTLAEVYQIGIDMQTPYHVYCGLQDNGAWGGPSATLDYSGIHNSDWYVLDVMGDGFYVQPDPTDHNIIYGNAQMNALFRNDKRIGRGQEVRPEASMDEPPYRFNWNSPVLISPHDPKTVYTGGNFLFRTTNGGHSWERISPDLTTDDPKKQVDSGGPITMDNTGAEIHCTIYTISESPVRRGVIWCGTDDGNVNVTRDGGKTWTNVVKNIKGLPAHTWCSRIEASHFYEGTAYAAFDGHRHDDYRTYVYKTVDFGKTWKSIKGNLPFGWVNVIREDLKNKNLLYVGTEFGIYASLDSGMSWFSLMNNLPTVSVHDITVHPRDNDLIIGTHGRGIWILDDISPLQEMTEEVFQADIHFFSIRPAVQYYLSSRREAFSSVVYSAKNPPFGLLYYVYLKNEPEAKPGVVIKDPAGEDIFKTQLRKKQGLQKGLWNLQFVPKTKEGKQVKIGGIGFVSAPLVSPGEYTIEITADGKAVSQQGMILPDPRFPFSEADRAVQQQVQNEVMILSKKMGLAVTAVKNVRRQLDKLKTGLDEDTEAPQVIQEALKTFEENFKPLEEEISPKGVLYRGSREMALRGGPFGGSYSTLILYLGMSLGKFPAPPTEDQRFHKKELSAKINKLVDRLNLFLVTDIVGFNEKLKASGKKTIRVPKKIEL